MCCVELHKTGIIAIVDLMVQEEVVPTPFELIDINVFQLRAPLEQIADTASCDQARLCDADGCEFATLLS